MVMVVMQQCWYGVDNVMVDIQEDLLPKEFVYVRTMREAEKKLFLIAYRRCRGNQTRMSEYMGITRTTVAKKLRQHNIIE